METKFNIRYWDFCVLENKPHYCKSNPITGLDRPIGFEEVEAAKFQENRHINVVRLSALRTDRLNPQEIPSTHCCYRLSRPQGHSAAGSIMSIKNSKDTIGNRTRDLPACSAVPIPTAPPRAPPHYSILSIVNDTHYVFGVLGDQITNKKWLHRKYKFSNPQKFLQIPLNNV
jgi:hypothetical protein